ncbi:MAG: hypothetical protein RLZZ427_1424 [Pseudomonadota bacterium]|jgi:hypothetical protein
MVLDDADNAALVPLFSPERLQALTILTGSSSEAIALHQQTLAVGSQLMKVVATIEIALRNAVEINLQNHFAVPNWLQQPPVQFQWRSEESTKITRALDSARRAEYAKLNQAGKMALDAAAYPNGRPAQVTHLQRSKARRKQIPVTHGKIIAELTLYFWKRLFGPEYQQSLWRPSLKRVFPNKQLKRADVAIRLEAIYQARNRLAHHEPVLHQRFSQTITAIEFVAHELTAQAGAGKPALAKLLAADIDRVVDAEAELRARLDGFRAA